MISRTYILKNLAQLDTAYRKADNRKQALYSSKLAILELCGWIELSMDDLVQRHAARRLRDTNNLNYVKVKIVRTNYGFDYTNNFRHMIMRMIGLVTLERVERAIGQAIIAPFSAQLNNLKAARNALAHTYVKDSGATTNIDSPSVTMARFQDIYVALKAYEDNLRSL